MAKLLIFIFLIVLSLTATSPSVNLFTMVPNDYETTPVRRGSAW